MFGQWRVPRFRDAYERLGEHLRLVLYDGRGTGHSQRDVDDFSLEAMLRGLPIPQRLSQVGFDPGKSDFVAQEIAALSIGVPRPVSAEDTRALLAAAL